MRIIIETSDGKVWESWTLTGWCGRWSSRQQPAAGLVALDGLESELRSAIKSLAITEGASLQDPVGTARRRRRLA